MTHTRRRREIETVDGMTSGGGEETGRDAESLMGLRRVDPVDSKRSSKGSRTGGEETGSIWDVEGKGEDVHG